MKSNEFNADDFEVLREKAEKIINNKDSEQLEELEEMTREEILQLFHELQVHQIELELQNEELREAQSELGKARARYYAYDTEDIYEIYEVTPKEANKDASNVFDRLHPEDYEKFRRN